MKNLERSWKIHQNHWWQINTLWIKYNKKSFKILNKTWKRFLLKCTRRCRVAHDTVVWHTTNIGQKNFVVCHTTSFMTYFQKWKKCRVPQDNLVVWHTTYFSTHLEDKNTGVVCILVLTILSCGTRHISQLIWKTKILASCAF